MLSPSCTAWTSEHINGTGRGLASPRPVRRPFMAASGCPQRRSPLPAGRADDLPRPLRRRPFGLLPADQPDAARRVLQHIVGGVAEVEVAAKADVVGQAKDDQRALVGSRLFNQALA